MANVTITQNFYMFQFIIFNKSISKIYEFLGYWMKIKKIVEDSIVLNRKYLIIFKNYVYI